MKFKLIYLFHLSNAIWQKCSQPCGGGIEQNDEGLKRACNYESCDIYSNQLLADGFMESNPGEIWTRVANIMNFSLETFFQNLAA